MRRLSQISLSTVAVTALALSFGGCPAADSTALEDIVRVQTDLGAFTIRLYRTDAPITTQNFVNYVSSGFYEGTIFYRVVPGNIVEGGAVLPDLTVKPENPPIINEATTRLSNLRGTIAMNRGEGANTAQSRFFVNLNDNTFLDPSPTNTGYAVFGQIIEGLDVLDAMSQVPTTESGEYGNLPVTPITIISMTLENSSPEADPVLAYFGDRFDYAARYSVWTIVTMAFEYALTNDR